jgi:hypothetical protein
MKKEITALDEIILEHEKKVDEIINLYKSNKLDLSKYEEAELTYIKAILKQYKNSKL